MEPSSLEVNGARSFPATAGPIRWFDIAFLVILGLVAVVLRFWTRSPMWLDEALTVNIASLPLDQIPQALRHDGHPPLYYVMLHWWMAAFGDSDRAIRALPGIFGVLAIPATWAMGRRLGGRSVAWCAAVVVAAFPFAVRYSTENRMYSLIMLLVPLAWLCADLALEKVRPLPLVGLALCTSALLWSQYWALWLGAAAATGLVIRIVRARRNGEHEKIRPALWVLGALGVGAVSFIPWLPTMLYQQAHTGTPWATRALPPTVIVTTVQAFGGTPNSMTELGGWLFAVIMVIGVFGYATSSGRIELDLRTRSWIRPVAFMAAATLGVGLIVMVATNSAFQPRYNAVWIPFAVVIGGVGIAVLRGPIVQRCALCLVLVASGYGWYKNVTLPRTQAQESAAVIEREGKPGDVVGVCPDQLGPSLARALAPGFQVGTFPAFGDPNIVDWVDYEKRTGSATAQEFADELLRRAGPNRRIFVVWSPRYRTHPKVCTDIVTALTVARPQNRQLVVADPEAFESENLTGFWPGPMP